MNSKSGKASPVLLLSSTKMLTTLALFLVWAVSVLSISVSNSSGSYTIYTDSSNSFTVTVNSANCDITSLLFGGTDYQYSSTHSHIASGLGSATVSYTTDGMYQKLRHGSHP